MKAYVKYNTFEKEQTRAWTKQIGRVENMSYDGELDKMFSYCTFNIKCNTRYARHPLFRTNSYSNLCKKYDHSIATKCRKMYHKSEHLPCKRTLCFACQVPKQVLV